MKAGTEPSPDAAQVHLCSCLPQASAANTHKGVLKKRVNVAVGQQEMEQWAAKRWECGGKEGKRDGRHLGGLHPTSSPSAVLMGAGEQ